MLAKVAWKLSEWVEQDQDQPPMTEEEIQAGIEYLKASNYPKPADCPEQRCPEYRPACTLGICKIAVQLTGDW